MVAPQPEADANTYLERVAARQARFRPSRAALSPEARYSIEPVFSIPQAGTHIHAFAAPPCSSHLYTGGSDGFVRRYALHATLNGTQQVPNLTSKPGGHERPPGTDLRQPVLSGYWENEEPMGDWVDDLAAGPPAQDDPPERQARVRWGPKTAALGPQSAVYSLAVQKEELWGLSGTAVRLSLRPHFPLRSSCIRLTTSLPAIQKGSINLWTVRHDEGQIRHVFRPDATSPPGAATASGHPPKAAVSALALDDAETSFLSGGWGGRIIVRCGPPLSLLCVRPRLTPSPGWTSSSSSRADLGPPHGRRIALFPRSRRADQLARAPPDARACAARCWRGDGRRGRRGRRDGRGGRGGGEAGRAGEGQG